MRDVTDLLLALSNLAGMMLLYILSAFWRNLYPGAEERRTAQWGKVICNVTSFVFALSVVVSMVLLSIAPGADLVALWNLFSQLNQYYPDMQTVQIVTFVVMVHATLTALVAFARGTGALRAVYATAPKSEPLQQAHERS